MIKLISFWNVVDLNRVASTSRSIHAALQQCWTVDTGLARWFDNPFDFRQMLGNCGAVVSGSTAVQFFDRTRYPASDLDIVIPITTTYSMGLWLMENGYTFQPRGTDFTDFVASLVTVMKRSRSHRLAKPMIRVFDFYGHPLSASDTGRHVQLITTRDDPFAHILQYHSSECANLASIAVLTQPSIHSCCHERNHMGMRNIPLPTSNLYRPEDIRRARSLHRCSNCVATEIYGSRLRNYL